MITQELRDKLKTVLSMEETEMYLSRLTKELRRLKADGVDIESLNLRTAVFEHWLKHYDPIRFKQTSYYTQYLVDNGMLPNIYCIVDDIHYAMLINDCDIISTKLILLKDELKKPLRRTTVKDLIIGTLLTRTYFTNNHHVFMKEHAEDIIEVLSILEERYNEYSD